MRHIFTRLGMVATLLFCTPVSVSFAQNDSYQQSQFVQSQGTVDVPRGLFSGGLNQEIREKAIQQAKLVALTNALARVTGPKADVISGLRKAFEERIDNVISDVTVLDEKLIDSDRRYTVRIRATVQWGQIDSIIRTSAAQGSAAPQGTSITQPRMTAATGQRVVFLALAREAESIKNFDTRRVEMNRRSDSQTKEQRSAEDSQSPNRTGTVDISGSSSSSTRESVRESGGSRTNRRDRIEYVPGNTQDLTTRINQTLTQNTVRATPYGLAVSACKLPNSGKFGEQFASSPEAKLPDELLGEIISRLRECSTPIRYFVIASVDVDGFGKHPNGGELASAKVRVEFFDVSDALPEPIATGDGRAEDASTNQTDAIRRVMSRSADVASDKIVNILRTQLNK